MIHTHKHMHTKIYFHKFNNPPVKLKKASNGALGAILHRLLQNYSTQVEEKVLKPAHILRERERGRQGERSSSRISQECFRLCTGLMFYEANDLYAARPSPLLSIKAKMIAGILVVC